MSKKNRRIYKNRPEEEFCKFAEALGFVPSKRGWPDFICINPRDGGIMLVEVKDTAIHPLKKEQMSVMRMLSEYGLPCYRWDSEEKTLQKINRFSKRRIR